MLRIEDLDTPRVVPGSTAGILRTLAAFGFEWDDAETYQSRRVEHYAAVLDFLNSRELTFECSCSRSQLADEQRYPGHCRAGPMRVGVPTATRLRVDDAPVRFTDRIQGMFRQEVGGAVGDILLRRRDQVVAYVLAVVIDDAAQQVSHVVRGADLLDNTPRQIHLQQVLGFPRPQYAHVPVLVEPGGAKLAKSARSVAVPASAALPQLLRVFALLNLSPPPELAYATLREAWEWATRQWDVATVSRRLAQPLGPENA